MIDFDRIPSVHDPKGLMDVAFHRASKLTVKLKPGMSPREEKQKQDCAKIDTIKDVLCERLFGYMKSFPSFNTLPPYYQQLANVTLDVGEVRHSLGAMQWAAEQIRKFSAMHQELIKNSRSMRKIGEIRRAYYGRISSVLKAIKKELANLEEARKVIRDYPVIKEGFTVCIVGFPNVGKSTLLNKLTGALPEVGAYAFTTRKLNLGYIREPFVQLIDTPGSLNRTDKMNMVERQADIAMRFLADAFVSVIDLTEPYPIADQVKLHKKVLSLKKPTLVYVSKADILEPATLAHIPIKTQAYTDSEKLKEEIKKLLP